ncbi:MAG: HYR domain-containing protein, partial [Dolichospermum sp.]
ITVLETELPTITCPADITVNNDLGNCSALVTVPAPAVADNCGIDTVINDYTNSADATGVYPVGTTVVTATATNAVGTSQATFEVIVKDVTAPTFGVINTVNASATNATGAIVNYTLPTATDNCSGVVNVVATPVSGSLFPIGTTIVTVVATDAVGNQNTTTFNVVVKDTDAPVAKTKNATVYLDATGNASITVADINNNSTDNVGITSLSLSQTNFNCSNIGKAIQLDASADGVTSNSNLTITGNSPRTFTAWVKPTASNNMWGVVHQGNNDCSGLMFGLGLQSGNRVTFWGGCRDFVSTLVVPQNQWTYIAAVYNGAGIITLYANGSSQSINLGSLNTQISKLFV